MKRRILRIVLRVIFALVLSPIIVMVALGFFGIISPVLIIGGLRFVFGD